MVLKRIIDLSHTSHDAQRRVLQLSRAPVMFSHSSAFTLCENPRNVPDDVLDQLKMNGGVCMICFLPNLCTSLTRAEKNPSVQSIVDHIVYVGSRIGYQHVGIGSDFDGMLEGPRGLDDVRGYSLLVEEMLRREMSHDEVKMVMGFNILRVLREVEELAFELQNDSSIATLADTVVSPWTDEQKEMLRQQGQKRGLV
jgi:membrane dipeptidase